MNPIPVTWCLAGALAATVAGVATGWTVRDWKRDSEVLEQFEAAAKNLDAARAVVDQAATAYEKEKQDAVVIREAGASSIRGAYSGRVVPTDCVVVPVAAGVLNDAITAANARAAGKPGSAVPTDRRAP
jgi:predicted RNA-binding Zn ribbon-like protein